jgi:O-antigen/teichoic acid export membrane protein
MGRGVMLLAPLSAAASVLNYASNLTFAHILGPAAYGDLTSLLALSVVAAVPFTAAQTRVASRVAQVAADRLAPLVRDAVTRLGVLGLAVTLLYCAAIPVVVHALRLPATAPALALAALIGVSLLFPALQGTLQGLERWAVFGVVGLAVAAARLAIGVPWALAGGGAGGAIGGQAIGMALCLAWLVWLLRREVAPISVATVRPALTPPDLSGVAAGASFVFYAILANCDVIVAKIFVSPREAGQYAALATVGKLVVFLPAAIAVIVVPSTATAGGSRRDRARVLRLAALMVAGTALLAIIPAALAPGFVVRTMFGARYAAIAPGVLPIVCAGGGLALLYLLVTFTVAIEDSRWTTLLVLGVVLQVALIGAFHRSATQIALDQAAVVGAVLACNEAICHPLLPWPARA